MDTFVVLVFDEIEKAHPQVLDLFLQILEDGRLVDGHGVAANFSQSIVIFTSNLGVAMTDPLSGRIEQTIIPGIPYEELATRMSSAIARHFREVIGRPELLNRISDKLVVFDFIYDHGVHAILTLQLAHIGQHLLEDLQIRLHFAPSFVSELQALCAHDLSEGGRAVGNKIERYLVNPPARYIFDHDCPSDIELTIVRLAVDTEDRPQLEISRDAPGL